MIQGAAALAQVLADLDRLGRPHALVGGLAVSTWCEPRFTKDVDVCVSVSDDAGAEATVAALLELGYRVVALVEHVYLDRLGTARMLPPTSAQTGILTDLLFASSGIEVEIAAAASRVEVMPGVEAPVARPGHLVVLKLLSRAPERPQDELDLRLLHQVLSADEIDLATSGVRLVTERGFHRDRDLPALLEDYLQG